MAIIQYLRSVKQAAWLGWKIDSNWTDPFLFGIYYLVRPLSSLLIVGFMFIVATAAKSYDPNYFAYIFIGSTFFVYMTQLSQTMAILIPEERGRFETIKQIYISPGSIRPYIVGRGLAAILNATIAVILTFVFGYLVFEFLFEKPLVINFFTINYPVLILSVTLGIVSLTAVGYILSSISLVSNRLQWSMSEYATGIFLLFGGVWYPPTVLPSVLGEFSQILPITWFLQSVRDTMLPVYSGQLLSDVTKLAVSSAASVLFGYTIFSFCENIAKKRGIIDRKAEG